MKEDSEVSALKRNLDQLSTLFKKDQQKSLSLQHKHEHMLSQILKTELRG